MSAVRTVLAPATIAALVREQFGMRDIASCVLHSVSIHDHYLIEADRQRLIFRVYNAEHSATPDDRSGLFELEVLAYLGAQRQPVAAPRSLTNGARFGRIDAGEGSRRYALFEFAPGRPAFPPSPAQARVMGIKVAELHVAMNGFRGDQPAVDLSVVPLLHDSVAKIRGAVGDRRPDDLAFLAALTANLATSLGAVDAQPRDAALYGIVGEHFNGTNTHWVDDQSPTFFSFSACARGWRAFDVAAVLWQTQLYGIPAEVWTSYLDGYESVRALNEIERASLPKLATLKMLQTMAFHIDLTKWMGAAFQDGAYWDRHFGPLRRWHEDVVSQ